MWEHINFSNPACAMKSSIKYLKTLKIIKLRLQPERDFCDVFKYTD